MTFTRYYWQLELDERVCARPAARSSPAVRRAKRSRHCAGVPRS